MKKRYLFAVITILAFLSSCKKDSSIGADILPGDDLLNVKYSDTFTLYAKTIADTFLRTDKLAKNYLGTISDYPLFGLQKSSIVVELDRPNTIYDDTLGPFTLDSVVLLLRYTSIYGDSTVPQSFNVSTINNKVVETNSYFSNNTSFPAGSVVGSVSNYYFQPSNRVKMATTDTTGSTNIFRVKLNSFVGYSILNLGQNILRDSASFKSAFPGIRIDPVGAPGKCMAEIDMSSTGSSMVIYYKDKRGGLKEMRLFTSIYGVSNGSIIARQNGINLFENTVSSGVQSVISSGVVSDSVNYIFGQGATTLRLSLPTVTNHGKIAVNKATIQLTQTVANSSKDFGVPSFLILLKRNSSGSLDVLPTGDGVGLVDSVGLDGSGNKISRYSINITKYIQAVVKGSEANSDLYVATYRSGGTDGLVNNLNSIINGTVINFGYIPSRVVVAGPNYSDAKYKMKLNLTYTLIE